MICELCPRKCRADRNEHRGYCGCPDGLRAARAGMHYYEEPFLSGPYEGISGVRRGSGTVFFSGCNLRCIFCQNHTISGDDSFGISITPARLSEIFLKLQEDGAYNINLVTGTPYIPYIAEALTMVRPSEKDTGTSDDGRHLHIPVVWNSSGYESTDALEMLKGLIDIWLPDFKTLSPELGKRYMNAPDYPEAAKEALSWMAADAGPARFAAFPAGAGDTSDTGRQDVMLPDTGSYTVDTQAFVRQADGSLHTGSQSGRICAASGSGTDDTGMMVSGVCVRHLVMPGAFMDTRRVLRYLNEEYGNNIWISLMSQYTPMRNDFPFRELNRKLRRSEYEKAVDYAIMLGLEQCMIQEDDVASESFIPVFDGTGIM